MMKHLTRSITIVLAVLATSAGVAGAVPETVSFTARLSGSTGPVDGTVEATFRVFDAATGGTMMWEETHAALEADEGMIYAELGSVDRVANGLDAAVFDGRPMFLEVVIDGETFDPRLPITSLPYAVRAGTADLLGSLGEGDVVTGVAAGTGLSGGGSGGAVSLSVDTTAVQARVAGTCSAGQAMRVIAADGTVTCQNVGDITGVTAGSGLSGGGNNGAVSLSVDTTVVQARVAGACNAGQAIRVISETGAVTCQNTGTGDITAVGAGAGLTGGGNSGNVSLAVDTSVIQARVGAACAAGSSIRQILANGGVVCQTDTAGSGDITGVAAGTGLTGGGNAGNVTLGLATNGVTTTHIADGTIGSADLATNSVQMAHTTAPIGSGTNSVTVYSNNTNSMNILTGSAVTVDSAGRCMVSINVRTDEYLPYNETFYAQALLAVGNSMNTSPYFSYGLEMSGAGNAVTNYHMAHSTYSFPVSAGQSIRAGCRVVPNGDFEGNNFICQATYVCN